MDVTVIIYIILIRVLFADGCVILEAKLVGANGLEGPPTFERAISIHIFDLRQDVWDDGVRKSANWPAALYPTVAQLQPGQHDAALALLRVV